MYYYSLINIYLYNKKCKKLFVARRLCTWRFFLCTGIWHWLELDQSILVSWIVDDEVDDWEILVNRLLVIFSTDYHKQLFAACWLV